MKTIITFSNWLKILALTTLLSVSVSSQAADMVLILDDIEGESRQRDYEKKIDVLAFSEGISISVVQGGSGSQVGRPNKQDLSITKWLDSSSPVLRSHLTSGRAIQSGRLLVFSEPGASSAVPYIKFEIELSNIYVSSVAMGGSGGDDRLTENLTLNYEAIVWTYTRDADGRPGTQFSASWDFTSNTPIP